MPWSSTYFGDFSAEIKERRLLRIERCWRDLGVLLSVVKEHRGGILYRWRSAAAVGRAVISRETQSSDPKGSRITYPLLWHLRPEI